MAITFVKPKNKETLSLIILGTLLVVFIVVVFVLFRNNPTLVKIEPEAVEPPAINFSNLEHPILTELESYIFLEQDEQIVGRENPFMNFWSPASQ